MKDYLKIETYGTRQICIGGVGTLFHQEGFPIGISARLLADKGVELSWFHVIKELHFQYTSNERLFGKIKAELEDAAVEGIKFDVELLREFCYADWERRREMIYDYLWKDVPLQTQKNFFINKLKSGGTMK